MMGISYYFDFNDSWGIMTSGFYDTYHFSSSTGKTKAGVLVVNAPEAPKEFDVNLTRTSGSGTHRGASIALAYTPTDAWHWQLGIAKTKLDINRFKTEFTTLDLTNNFSGSFDYKSYYEINTIFLSAELQPRPFLQCFSYRPHVIVVRNAPRVGFQGRFTGPDFDYSGDTQQAGFGRHIPDNYMGVGVVVTHEPTGISLDLGATFYNYIVEPLGHGGISSPLLLSIAIPLM